MSYKDGVLLCVLSDFFSSQLAPLVLGSFAYKAACLIVAYRDNEKLRTSMTWEQAADGYDSDDDIDFSDLPPF